MDSTLDASPPVNTMSCRHLRGGPGCSQDPGLLTKEDPVTEFQHHFGVAKTRAVYVCAYLKEETEKLAESDDEDDSVRGRKGKVLFLKQQYEAYKFIAKLLLKQKCAIDLRAMNGDMSVEHDDNDYLFFKEAARLLDIIAITFDRTMQIAEDRFVKLYQIFYSIWENHRYKIMAVPCAFSGWGALYSTGWLGNWHVFGYLGMGIKFLTAPFFLSATSITLGVGLSIVLAIELIDVARSWWHQESTQEADQHRQQYDRLMSELHRMESRPPPVKDLSDLCNEYEKVFVHVIAEPTADDKCIACQEAVPNGPCGVDGVAEQDKQAAPFPRAAVGGQTQTVSLPTEPQPPVGGDDQVRDGCN